jgi:hypothetical protein
VLAGCHGRALEIRETQLAGLANWRLAVLRTELAASEASLTVASIKRLS